MIASVNNRSLQRSRSAGCALLALLLGACAGTPAVPAGSVLEAERQRGTRVPDGVDQGARQVLEAALVESPEQIAAARDRFVATQTAEARDARLLGYVDHLVAATSGDAIDYRAACLELLERNDLDPALREHLEVQVEEDPLRLARIRISDSRKRKGARVFNAFASAAGRSMLSFHAAPARMANAALNLAVARHLEDPITLQERQALHHWKRYVETHPAAPETPQLVERIESAQLRWFAMKRKRSLRAARKGLESGRHEVAFLLADRALRFDPEDPIATELRDSADTRLREKRSRRTQSLSAAATLAPEETGAAARTLALALLDPNADLLAAAEALLARGDREAQTLRLDAEFARVIALAEAGRETESWEALRSVARNEEGGIATHARALEGQAIAYPYPAFRRAIHRDRKDLVGQVMLGHLAHGPRDLDLPRPLEWMIDGPAFVGTLGGIPQRLVQTAFRPPPSKRPAVHGYRYLERHGEGEHAGEVREWLYEHERERENFVGAHQLAMDIGKDDATLEELREQAATQALESAQRQTRRDLKLHYLNEVAQRYEGTESGDEAKTLALDQLHDAASQHIRISRGFLRENPHVAGPEGLGLRPGLIDKNTRNGELHPDGVTLLGGRRLEISLLPRSGDVEDEPVIRREILSTERLARLVALLDETAIRNALVDPLAGFEPDADRDLFFERARLGVADSQDHRPSAASSYAFVGVREKYSMVRTHEPVLPFDLVVQGSFPDLGLGAFPRLRSPKPTPDAILYR